MTDTIVLPDHEPDAPSGAGGPDDLRTRWQPTRAGIVNVWRYADEVFTFHRGRLLLRGPNGSGKSMALELLLPFLLDANASPHRISSGQRSRGGLYDRLVGETDDAGSPVGFLWIEFRRRDRDGEPDTCTIGVRLRASASTRQVDKAWFVTPQRIGHDLHLLDDDRVPLAAAALGEALAAGGGHLYDDTSSYRERVRERLFPGTTAQQYDAVITALLALRQEKLSQNLDLDRLSATLTSALPPLDARDIADAAEGFRQLDQRRDNLVQLEDDLAIVARVAVRQRAYARTLLRAAAGDLIATQSRRDGAVRILREATDAHAAAEGRAAEVARERTGIATRLAELTSRADTLRQRDAYRAGETLEALRQEVGRAGRASEEAASRASDAAERLADAEDEERRARADADAAAQLVTAAWNELADTADTVRAGGPADAAATAEPDAAEALLLSWIDGRAAQVATIRERLRQLEAAVRDRDEQQRRVDAAAELRERRAAELATRRGELDAAVAELRTAVEVWRGGLAVLAGDEVIGPDTVDVDSLDDLPARVAGAARPHHDRLARREGEVAGRDRELADEERDLRARREALVAATEPTVPAPPWRRNRTGLAGAPLWRLVDFADDTDDRLRDRIEAALAVSGLLDAWVAPDGRLELAGEGSEGASPVADLFAVVTDRVGGATLADVLRPEPGRDVPEAVVRGILEAVALADRATDAQAPAVVGRDGTFRLGTLSGAAPDRPAGYIGASARERQRQRDIAALDVALTAVADQRRGLAAEAERIAAERASLEADVAAFPAVAPAVAARTALTTAAGRLADADEAVSLATEELRGAEAATRTAQRSLHAAAADAELPTTADALDAFDAELRLLERRTGAWVSRRRQHASLVTVLTGRAAAVRLAAGQAAELAGAATDAATHHAGLRARLDAVEGTVGAAYREVVALIEAAQEEHGAEVVRDRGFEEEQRRLAGELGALGQKLVTAETDRDAAEAARDAARLRLAGLLRDGFAGDATLDVALDDPDGVTAALEAARALARELADVVADDAAVSSVQLAAGSAAHEAGRQLGGRADLTFVQTGEGWWLLRARVDGLERSISQLEAALRRDLQLARDEFAEHERELYDRTLTEGLRRHLVARIRDATALKDRINRQLRRVETGAGVGVQLDWVVDDADATSIAEARPLLLKAPELLAPDEVEALHRFLRARIDAVRTSEEDAGASWEGRLTAAFDYRSWHRFALKVSHHSWGGEFRPATSRRLAQLSTGERSVVLHLPMLASVAAHYDATPDGTPGVSPRLILLDELFVGVDPVNRAQLFGMFVEWDLDAVLTSDHEWCRYRELDGIAIHQVHGDADPVVTTRFVWDGREQRADAALAVGGAVGSPA